MHPIEVRQAKEIILVSDDVHAGRRLSRKTLGLDPDANLIELWGPRRAPAP